MIRYSLACVTAFLLTAGPAWAQGRGDWSIGAGFGGAPFFEAALLPVGALTSVPPVTLPPLQLNLEKKLGARASLLLGMSGSYQDTQAGAPFRSGAAAATAGMRFRVTEDDALVDVSVYGALHVGYAAVSQERVLSGVPGDVRTVAQDIVGGGLNAGFSVERSLMERLSVRLNAAVFQASYSDLRIKAEGTDWQIPAAATAFDVSLFIRPGLELRMYF